MRRLLLCLAATLALLAPVSPAAHAAPGSSGSAPTLTAPVSQSPAAVLPLTKAKKKKCTKTSTGKCIKGGQFCPKAKNGKKGRDAKGRTYICKKKHWRKV